MCVCLGGSADGSVFWGVSAEKDTNMQGCWYLLRGCVCIYLSTWGCVCVWLQMSSQGSLPKGSGHRVCLEVSHPRGDVCLGVSVHGVSEYLLGGWGLSAWKVSVHGVSVSGWGFCIGEVSGQRCVFPEGCLPSAGVFLGAVCGSALGEAAEGSVFWGVCSGECLLRGVC